MPGEYLGDGKYRGSVTVLVGDEEVVEWPYGARAPVAVRPLVLDRRWADYRWAEFGEAYTELQLELDRAAVTRLHTLITAA